MPLVLKKTGKDLILGIWESSETLDDLLLKSSLTGSEECMFHSFRSEARKREWLTVRVLFRLLHPAGVVAVIRYDEKGKPLLNDGYSISISHTKTFVAVLLSAQSHAGVDLETIRPEILRLASKFINEQERAQLPEDRKIEHLHVIWGAKEVLYKIHGAGGVDFKKHLHTEAFTFTGSGEVAAHIRIPGSSGDYLVNYEVFGDMLLAYTTSRQPDRG